MPNQQQRMLQRDLASVVKLLQSEGNNVGPYSGDYRNLLSNHGKMVRSALTLIFWYASSLRRGTSIDILSRGSQQESHFIVTFTDNPDSDIDWSHVWLDGAGSISTADDEGNQHAVRQKVIIGATAIEMLHLATLVHDDVLDNAPIRRGKPTVHTLRGNKTAIYLGDLLLSRYMEIMASVAPNTAFVSHQARNINEIVSGDLLQESLRHNTAVTKDDYDRVITGKTATLFRMACVTGIELSVKEPCEEEINQALEIGQELGIAFQIIDDIGDFDVSKQSGKPKLEDISAGIYTLPVVLALKDDPDFAALLQHNDTQLTVDYLNAHPQYIQSSKDEARKHLNNVKSLVSQTARPRIPEASSSLICNIADTLIETL